MPSESSSVRSVAHQLLCFDVSEATLHRMWDLESLGISSVDPKQSDPVLDAFNRSVTFENDRYVVSLPWKQSEQGCVGQKLLNNVSLARKRLDSLSKRLSRDPALEQRYHVAVHEMEDSGVIHEVPSEEMVSKNPVFYMPHRPVVRESRVSTKVRPVFDASAAGPNGMSLNDCMETGPCLIPNLVEILIRFRRWPVALSADIQKAFLQIRVRQEDQDVHRFLWNDGDKIRVMRFDRVPFGNKASPFLLNATIKYHLSQFPPSRAVEELDENLYVDDFLSGADSSDEGCCLMKESLSVMKKANMTLTKWSSNNSAVSGMIACEFQDKHLDVDVFKVLGLEWRPIRDMFLMRWN